MTSAAANDEHHHPRSWTRVSLKDKQQSWNNERRREFVCIIIIIVVILTRPSKEQQQKATKLFSPNSSSMPLDTESDHCIIIVGVSRSKLAALLFSVMLISLFLTVHIIYDSALYIQVRTNSCSSICILNTWVRWRKCRNSLRCSRK